MQLPESFFGITEPEIISVGYIVLCVFDSKNPTPCIPSLASTIYYSKVVLPPAHMHNPKSVATLAPAHALSCKQFCVVPATAVYNRNDSSCQWTCDDRQPVTGFCYTIKKLGLLNVQLYTVKTIIPPTDSVFLLLMNMTTIIFTV